MSATAKPNPELAAALAGARAVEDYKDYIEERITTIAQQAAQDTFVYRQSIYSRQTYTTAMLLAGDNTIREMARQKGIDVRAFDNTLGQVQQLILENTNQTPPAAKMVTALRKMLGI